MAEYFFERMIQRERERKNVVLYKIATYRKNRINIEQDPNEWEENAHGDFRE
jgi:hypothetical protein